MGDWVLVAGGAALGKTLPNSLATSVGLAYFRRNTRISVSASALLSIAWMISARCRMFDCVSVTTIELPASFATIVACGETNDDKSDTSCRASTNRMGMICVTISALLGMLSGIVAGLDRDVARLRVVLVHNCQRPPVADGGVTVFVQLGVEQIHRLVLRHGMACSMTVTVPLTCVSCTMMNPAASLK